MLPPAQKKMVADGIRLILQGLGESPEREGLYDTPARVAEMYSRVLDGNFEELESLRTFEDEADPIYDNVIMIHHVPFYAFCEHHMALFQGTFGIAYLPDERVVGLSKLVRVFRHFCKRVTIQERLTCQTVDCLMSHLKPKGAIVYVEAEHTCMTLRGVRAPGSITSTSAARGVFKESNEFRASFLEIATK